MRASAWTIPGCALLLWLAVVLWPAIASVDVILTQPRTDIEIRHSASLFMVSGGWGLAVALVAIILGWAPGRWLGSAIGRRGFIPLATLMLVPICLPAYVVFYAWWQAWPADTPLYRWAVAHDAVQHVRYATLLTGLVCWSWPIVAWCVAGSAAATPAEREELLKLDGAGALARVIDRLRRDGRGLMLGGLIVMLATFNNTTCFDLAQIYSFGNELRAIVALGASRSDVLSAALPAVAMTMLGAIAVWLMLGTSFSNAGHHGFLRLGDARNAYIQSAVRPTPPHPGAITFTGVIWLVSVAVPLGLLARNVTTGPQAGNLAAQLDQFRDFYGRGLVNSLAIGLTTAALAALVAVGLAWMWHDRRPGVRALAHAQTLGWIVAAAVPGTLYGIALSAAYNRFWTAELIYLNPTILVLGGLGRFGFIGALLGRWVAMREPRNERDLRTLDGADGVLSLLLATWPRVLAAASATFGIVLVLSMSEIPMTAMVRPPGLDVITPSILNDMHFQRPQTVMIATGIFLVLALCAATITVGAWWIVKRSLQRGACAK